MTASTILTSRDRFLRMFDHRPADRVPIVDSPWGATLQRWRDEGMPVGVDWQEYFGVDRMASFGVDNSPRYEARTIDETETFRIFTTNWGVTQKQWRHIAGTPEYLDHAVKDPDTWQQAKARMTPARDRVPWERLERDYPRWRERGDFIVGRLWFGFDVTHSWMIGTERSLIAIVEQPEWLADIYGTQLELCLTLMDMAWEAGYTFDAIRWPDDMGYKHNQFFSVDTYRELLKPFHQRAIEWAHAKGIKAILHSCGDVNPMVPELLEIGLDCLNPLEVKAGMDPVRLKETYGDRLVLYGGINAANWDKPERVKEEMMEAVPRLKEAGGYILASDHSIPSAVSLEEFRDIVALAKKLGSYA